MSGTVRLHAPKLETKRDRAEYRVIVDGLSDHRELWFSIPASHGALLSPRADAALLMLLVPAMLRGQRIEVHGEVTDQLQHAINRGVQEVLATVNPSLQRIEVVANTRSSAATKAGGIATALSCGVDSFSTVLDHDPRNALGLAPITHGLLSNIGSFVGNASEVFRVRVQQSKAVAELLGIPLIDVDSNAAQFYNPYAASFVSTHTLRNAAVGYLLAGGISAFLYSSAFHLRHTRLAGGDDLAYSDPILLPLLSSNIIECRSVGGEYTRVQKTARLCGDEIAQQHLDVCTAFTNDRNCSRCGKCLRTLLTLDLLGGLDKFDRVFDLRVYRQERSQYIAAVLASKSPLQNEIRELARSKNIRWPKAARAYSHAVRARNFVRDLRARTRRQAKNWLRPQVPVASLPN